MAIRKILTEGDPALTKVCHSVTKFDQKLWDLLDDLKETLEEAYGAGLAAPQVGILRRAVIVMDENFEPIELVNPEIIAQSGEQTGLEGCLSVPGEYGIVTRPNEVTVRAQDRDGNWFEKTGEALCARAFCHEIDHLHGVLFTSHVRRMLTPEELQNGIAEEEE